MEERENVSGCENWEKAHKWFKGGSLPLSHPGSIGIMIIPNMITFINEDDDVNGDMLPGVMAFKMMKLENYRKKSGDTLRQKTKDKRQKTKDCEEEEEEKEEIVEIQEWHYH